MWRKYRNYVNVKWTSGCHLRDYRPFFRKEKSPETLISQRFRGSHSHRGDKIRTCGLRVPNAALYQTEPRLDLYLLLRTNRSKQMLSYLIFTEASSPVLLFYCFSACLTTPFFIVSRRSVFCLITNVITPESTCEQGMATHTPSSPIFKGRSRQAARDRTGSV